MILDGIVLMRGICLAPGSVRDLAISCGEIWVKFMQQNMEITGNYRNMEICVKICGALCHVFIIDVWKF